MTNASSFLKIVRSKETIEKITIKAYDKYSDDDVNITADNDLIDTTIEELEHYTEEDISGIIETEENVYIKTNDSDWICL